MFRKEVVEHRSDTLRGSVNIALPVSWQIVGGLFFVIVVVAALFLSFAGYSRTETVSGIIAPEAGVASIVPPRAGVVSKLSVKEGATVSGGDALAVIRTDETLIEGTGSSVEILQSLERQESGLRNQEQQIEASATAERTQLRARISGLQADIAGLREQIIVQENLVESAQQELELAKVVAERGFVSRRDILQREEVFLSRQQQLSQLRQNLAGQEAAVSEAQSAIKQASALAGTQISALASQRSDIAQRRTGANAAGAFRLNAPIAGRVTALTARRGQAVSPQAPIMLIVPTNSELRVELYVPSAAIGFLEKRQEVRLALDAFPYQRFGTLPAHIISIGAAPVVQTDGEGNAVPVYLVTAQLSRDQISGYGKERPLIAGMTLTARIVTEKQSLLQWLFEPLFAVRKR